MKSPILIAVMLCVIDGLSSALASDQPMIESIEGDKVVVVITPKGNVVGVKGTEIQFGDKIKTSPQASAKIRYPDGSKLVVGRGTEISILQSLAGIQYNQLEAGQVRGIITKPVGAAAIANPKPRFIIRTRAAVMGVRGTDFVYDLDPASLKSGVHTLSGKVEVAKDEETLMAGKGVSVSKGQFVQAEQGQVGQVTDFDLSKYSGELRDTQPGFVTLVRGDPEVAAQLRLEAREGSTDPLVVQTLDDQKPKRPWFKFLNFQFNALYVRESGSEVYTGELSWNPVLELPGPFAIRGQLGVFHLKGSSTDDQFTGFEIAPLLSVSVLRPLVLEAGIGIGGWDKYVHTNPLALGNVAWILSEDRFLERIFVGASYFESSSILSPNKVGIAQIKFGIGVQF